MTVPGTNDVANRPSLGSLKRFAQKPRPAERCEMCSKELAAEHAHLIEPQQRKLLCACDACALLFASQEGTKYRRVPRDARYLPDFRMSDDQWNALMIPIEMAFFFRSSSQGRVIALYPSPAGATESLLELEMWEDVEKENPALAQMSPDVEALLANRVGVARGVPSAYYIVPIDECYKLVGLIRMHWRGLSGGTEVWREINGYFSALRKKTVSASEVVNA
jgi:hypothetical protein